MRIVIRSPDPREARLAQEKLEAAGVKAVALTGAAPAPEGEDIVIIDASDRRRPGTADFAHALAGAAIRPVAIVAASEWRRPPPLGLEIGGPYDSWVAFDAPPALLARQIKSVLRMGVAEEELRRRRVTAAELQIAPPTPPRARRLKALYIGAPSPFFLALERQFATHRGLITAAFSSFSGFDHLHDEFFDAVVLNGAADPATAISLCAALRRNAGLNHLPTLVVTQANDEATASAAIERGAAAVVAEDCPSEEGVAWLFDAIRRERRRRDAEEELRGLRDRMGDPTSGLFTAPTFEAHLARLAEDHQTTGRRFSLLALRVLPAHGARAPREEAWRKSFREVATLASRLIRDTDSGAALGRDLIVAALPTTPLKGAQRTAERIAAVLECTSFAAGEADAGPLVLEQSSVELKPGESGRALLARALHVFDLQEAIG